MKYQVACFSQMDVMSSRIEGNPDAALGGACHCFSIHWLRLVLSDSGELPEDRLAKIKRGGGGLNLLMNFVYRVRYDQREMIESDKMLFRLRGLKSLCPTIDVSGYSFRTLLTNIVWREGGFIYTFNFGDGSLEDKNEKAHSMAFYRTSVGVEGLIYVFDPGFGEFHVIPEEFSTFWQELLARYGFPCTHVLRHVVVSGKDNVSG